MTGTLVDAAVCLLLVSAAAVVVSSVERPEQTAPDRTLSTLATVTQRVTYPVTPNQTRTRHATLAQLLAVGAVADATGDRPVVRAIRRVVRETVGNRVRIVASWRPDAPLSGRVTVGPTPPPDGVRAATLVVPIESSILRVTVPPERRALARAGAPAAIRDRYRTLAAAYGVQRSVDSVAAAIRRLRAAIDSRHRQTTGRVLIVVRSYE